MTVWERGFSPTPPTPLSIHAIHAHGRRFAPGSGIPSQGSGAGGTALLA